MFFSGRITPTWRPSMAMAELDAKQQQVFDMQIAGSSSFKHCRESQVVGFEWSPFIQTREIHWQAASLSTKIYTVGIEP